MSQFGKGEQLWRKKTSNNNGARYLVRRTREFGFQEDHELEEWRERDEHYYDSFGKARKSKRGRFTNSN